ncbi:MAG: acetolactate synthase-1/2/3 large subunit [Paracoccaceae bacterium]
MNCSDVITRYLEAAGIKHIFGYPGDPSVELLETARRNGIEFVLARREGTAGLMAAAYGQITGKPGVCLSTLGPGSSNLVNAVASAKLDRTPMIALSGQIDGKREHTFTHQVLDHNAMFAPISKWAAPIRTDTVATVMRRALRTAVAERPGPVHITTGADVVGAEATDTEIRLPPMMRRGGGFETFTTDGARPAAAVIKDARRPVIVAGIGAVRAEATAALTRLAEEYGCPVVVAPMAKGVIAEDHPYFAGTLDMACNQFVWDFLANADLIVTAGFDPVELIKPWTPDAPVIHVDTTPNTDQIYRSDIEMVGDISAALDALRAGIGQGARWRESEIADHRAQLNALYYAGKTPGKLNPTDVVDVARAVMPRDTVVTTDVGSHKLLVGQGWTTYGHKGVLMSNGLSSMGYSLPAAMTAKLLMPDREIVCFTGDGGLAMVQGELRLAASLKLGMKIIVFCDNSLNRIELKQMARQYPSSGTTIDPTDVVKLSESMDCDAVEANSVQELEAALSATQAPDRPLVIAANIDPAQYAAQF